MTLQASSNEYLDSCSPSPVNIYPLMGASPDRGAFIPSPYLMPTADLSPYMNEPGLAAHKQPLSRKNGVSTFIGKLHSMVEDPRFNELIAWSPSGQSFLILNASEFAEQVLPNHFKHSNFSSFVRLLNMYGFHKVNKTPRGQRGTESDIWEFSHPDFHRDRPHALRQIRRRAMDSEVLRNDNGDMHSTVESLQASQADLCQKFHVLQENFSNLLKRYEDTKQMQAEQQATLCRLVDTLQGNSAGLMSDTGLANLGISSPTPPTMLQPPKVIVTSSSLGSIPGSFQGEHWNTPSPCASPILTGPSNAVDMAINTPLPPSPIPSYDGSPTPGTAYMDTFEQGFKL